MNAPVTNAELEQFYGTDMPHRVRDEIVETITKTVRKVSHKALGVPYIRTIDGRGRVVLSPLEEVTTNYGVYGKSLAALMAVIEKSDCPLVAAYRAALANDYADAWAEEVEDYTA